MPKRLLSAIALALLLAAPNASPDSESTVLWSRTSNDSVAAPESSSPQARRGSGGGYATEADAILERFTVRLSPSGEGLRDHVIASAVDASGASGIMFEVAPGTADFTESPADGNIHVTVADNSPCGPLGGRTVGCGGYSFRETGGLRTVVSGVVWIAPNLESRGGTVLRDTVLHEFGHALGLAHYDEPHDGRHQVMRSVVGDDLGSYQTGDRAGLADLATVG